MKQQSSWEMKPCILDVFGHMPLVRRPSTFWGASQPWNRRLWRLKPHHRPHNILTPTLSLHKTKTAGHLQIGVENRMYTWLASIFWCVHPSSALVELVEQPFLGSSPLLPQSSLDHWSRSWVSSQNHPNLAYAVYRTYLWMVFGLISPNSAYVVYRTYLWMVFGLISPNSAYVATLMMTWFFFFQRMIEILIIRYSFIVEEEGPSHWKCVFALDWLWENTLSKILQY